ncbi:hypothetical protein [Caballeronia sp. INSB1]|uniref:hypothetical protein n=1 Tax=Caballeronia sp. INSB1 TaxID=2921751 RepID=UPI0020329103|nr:hypothetical protein [Caballeronia sp. INSB1]
MESFDSYTVCLNAATGPQVVFKHSSRRSARTAVALRTLSATSALIGARAPGGRCHE